MNNNKKYISFITIPILVLIDQISKNGVVEYFSHQTMLSTRITSFLNIVLVKNKGVTFGLFNSIKYSNIIFFIIGLIAIIYLIKWLLSADRKIIYIALNLVIAGAIGNLIDRFRWGAVIDFLDFHYKKYHWYSFNVADSAICVGVVILLVENIINDLNNKK